MKWLFSLLRSWFAEWKEEQRQLTIQQENIKQETREAITEIRKATEVPPPTHDERMDKLKRRSKELGLCFALLLILPFSLYGQDAYQRIDTLSHEELKTYARSVVDLARDQSTQLEIMATENKELRDRLLTIQKQLAVIETSVEKLAPPAKPRRWVTALRWMTWVVPAVASVVR